MKKKEIENYLKDCIRNLDKFTNIVISDTSCFISGGSIVSLLLNEIPNDIDIWFTDVDIAKNFIQTNVKNTEMFYKTFPREDWTLLGKTNPIVLGPPGTIELGEKTKTSKSYYGDKKLNNDGDYILTNNAYTIKINGIKYQFCFRRSGPPMWVQQDFDFIHCVNYYSVHTGLVLNKFAMESILTKELKYIGSSKFPVHSFIRMCKFIQRGWTISPGEILKICWDMNRICDKKELTEYLKSPNLDWLVADLHDFIDRKSLFEVINKSFN